MITNRKPSTRKTIENARKSFESVTGKKLKKGTTTIADVEQWLNSLREMGRSIGTCRTYLSFVKQLAGLDAELPARGQSASRSLSDAELKTMLGVVRPDFYALVASLVLNSTSVLEWTWGDLTDLVLDIPIASKMILVNEASRRGKDIRPLLSYGTAAHWVNEIERDELIFCDSPHAINRRLKTLARKAGIGKKDINITALKSAHRRLWTECKTADQIVRVLGINIAAAPGLLPGKRPAPRDPRLHGIGRRSALIRTA